MYAIVLAGGVGTRLWPRSRNSSPKQFIELVTEKTLLQETLKRLDYLMPPENIVVVTGESYATLVEEQVPTLPKSNILLEPSGRGTAPAIGLGLLHVARLAAEKGEKDPVVGSFHADHIITKATHFCQVVAAAAKVAEQDYIVTLGITPNSPHLGYGYIERGEQLEEVDGLPVYRVARFVEKPPRPTAEQYLETGRYSWNSGMFMWRLSLIMKEYKAYLPDLYSQLLEIDTAYGRPNSFKTLVEIWNEVRSETIDVGIAEKSQCMAVLPADIGWSDVGDWSAVAELISAVKSDEAGNAVIGQHVGLGTKNSLIFGSSREKLIATIGLEDMIVVDTKDVLLVARRSQNQEVKKIVEQLKQSGLDKYL
ncbi:MAG: mannose-1-phosphate guanylyltransferase [Chloroflexota bacterium]